MSFGSASESLNVEGAADVAEDIEPSGVVLLSFFVIETKTTIMGKRTKSRVISDGFWEPE